MRLAANAPEGARVSSNPHASASRSDNLRRASIRVLPGISPADSRSRESLETPIRHSWALSWHLPRRAFTATSEVLARANMCSSDAMPRLAYVNSPSGSIVISGAREHNLRDIDVVLPRDSLVVITGLSGSGKSSLAFDTIYAEGQRRYVESLSAYARQFLGQMEKPDVDSIEGLSPAISIDQKTTSRNPRS